MTFDLAGARHISGHRFCALRSVPHSPDGRVPPVRLYALDLLRSVDGFSVSVDLYFLARWAVPFYAGRVRRRWRLRRGAAALLKGEGKTAA